MLSQTQTHMEKKHKHKHSCIHRFSLSLSLFDGRVYFPRLAAALLSLGAPERDEASEDIKLRRIERFFLS